MTTMFDRIRSLRTNWLCNTPVARWKRMSEGTPRWSAGRLTHAALGIAVERFANVPRKGGDTPYLSHLLAVSALVMEHGGDEIQTAAGLLHDVLEDTKIPATELVELLQTRGVSHHEARAVVDIVEATTDGTLDAARDDQDWPARKRTYLGALRSKPRSHPALLVSLADKVHNIESTRDDVRSRSTIAFYDQPWFNAKAPEQKWYYQSLARIFREKLDGESKVARLLNRLESAVHEIFSGVPDTVKPELIERP